jgi:hypothetical protein
MKKGFSVSVGFLITWLCANAVFAQNNPDTCEVYLVDRQAASKVSEALIAAKSREEAEEKVKSAVKVLGKFIREVGEEVLTNRTFSIPNSRLIATASVMYTDEFQERMLLGIAVSKEAKKNALDDLDSAVAEVSYSDKPYSLRVKKFIKVDGRPFTVGVFCQFNMKGSSQ